MEEQTYITKTKNLPLETNFDRSGLVPYFVDKGEIYFIFALDTKYGEMTDMGGGIEDNEDFVDTAIRELYEESLGIFDFQNDKKFVIENSICVYNSRMTIIFQEIKNFDYKTVLTQYRNLYRDFVYKGNSANLIENSLLLWISSKNVKNLLKTNNTLHETKIPKYVLTDIQLPDCLSKTVTNVLYRNIKSYPKFYDRVKELLEKIIDSVFVSLLK